MEGLWSRQRAADPFVLSALNENALLRYENLLSEDGLFKNIDFTSAWHFHHNVFSRD